MNCTKQAVKYLKTNYGNIVGVLNKLLEQLKSVSKYDD